MKCPICDEELKMSERQGIEIDYCPKCRGVWLDRGELDKIIERSGSINSSHNADSKHYDDRPRDRHEYRENDHQHKKKRKGSFLEDLFEFGG